jgi:hypothetical protein
VQHIADLSYSTLMQRVDCSNDNHCILHCLFNYNNQEIEQTLFLIQPKNYQLYQPNLQIQSIQQVSPTEVSITITANRPALFVWLDVSANISGYFSQNGFHMFEATRIITFHSWTPITDFDSANRDFFFFSTAIKVIWNTYSFITDRKQCPPNIRKICKNTF